MIFTECPYCDEPQLFDWESGDPSGWFPSRCSDCGNVMWVFAGYEGETLSHEEFKERIAPPEDHPAIDEAAKKVTASFQVGGHEG